MNVEERNAILDFIRKDSKAAFTILFELHSNKIYNLALHYFNNTREAEEIVQEVFLKIWTKRSSIKNPEAFGSFLYTIAKNMIFDALRKQLHVKAYSDYLKLSDFNKTKNTEETIFYNELETLYRNVIEKLPSKRKEVFLMCRKQGLSHQEIADKLGISIRTVEEHIRQATKYLRKVLKKRYEIMMVLIGLMYSIFFRLPQYL